MEHALRSVECGLILDCNLCWFRLVFVVVIECTTLLTVEGFTPV